MIIRYPMMKPNAMMPKDRFFFEWIFERRMCEFMCQVCTRQKGVAYGSEGCSDSNSTTCRARPSSSDRAHFSEKSLVPKKKNCSSMRQVPSKTSLRFNFSQLLKTTSKTKKRIKVRKWQRKRGEKSKFGPRLRSKHLRNHCQTTF